MKNAFLISMIGGLTFVNFFSTPPVHNRVLKAGNNIGEIFITSISYHLDAVKSISTYRLKNEIPGTKPAYARIVFPVFADGKLNALIKKTILSPFTVKHMFTNSLMTTLTLPAATDPLYQTTSNKVCLKR